MLDVIVKNLTFEKGTVMFFFTIVEENTEPETSLRQFRPLFNNISLLYPLITALAIFHRAELFW